MENEVEKNVVDGYYNISEYFWIYRAHSTSKLLALLQEKGKIKGIKVCLNDETPPSLEEYEYYQFLDEHCSPTIRAAIHCDDKPSQRESGFTSWILLGKTFAFAEWK